MSATLELTRKLVRQVSLDEVAGDFSGVAEEIMSGHASPVAASSFLTAMAFRGESAAALAAFAGAMRRHAVEFLPRDRPLPSVRVDTCGTGGDHSNSFNISTASAFIVAGTGVAVAKHGNRGITSRSGSADVLEALGVAIEVAPALMADRLLDTGLAFLYAPSYHPAMRHVGPIRRELGFRTLFNLVGPLANPARATHQVVGVYAQGLVWIVADALLQLGVEKALVVHGHGGMDEITLSGPSHAVRVSGGRLDPMEIHPDTLGLVTAGPESLAGGTAADNALIIEQILQGRGTEAATDIVLLNAAAALSLVHDLPLADCLALGRESLSSGKALAVLEAHRALREGPTQ